MQDVGQLVQWSKFCLPINIFARCGIFVELFGLESLLLVEDDFTYIDTALVTFCNVIKQLCNLLGELKCVPRTRNHAAHSFAKHAGKWGAPFVSLLPLY